MQWLVRYSVSLLPLGMVLGVMVLSEWAFNAFGCATYGKDILPCYAYGIDITRFLGVGLFWCKILLPVMWFVSVPWFVGVACLHVEAWWKARCKS